MVVLCLSPIKIQAPPGQGPCWPYSVLYLQCSEQHLVNSRVLLLCYLSYLSPFMIIDYNTQGSNKYL